MIGSVPATPKLAKDLKSILKNYQKKQKNLKQKCSLMQQHQLVSKKIMI